MKTHLRLWRFGFLPLFTMLALVGAMAGLSWAAPGALSWSWPVKLSTPPGPSWFPQLARDPASGDLFVAWADGGLGEEEILGRRWDHTSGAWTALENLSRSEWSDRSPLLFLGSRGQGLLIWTRQYAASQGAPADGTDLVWRAYDGLGWSAEQVLWHRDFYLPGAYGLIPVETPDTILLFITYGNGYRTTEYRAGGWSEPTPWAYLTFQNPEVNPILAQVIMGEGGLLHAAAFGENSSQDGYDRYFRDAYYLTYDGAQWSVPLNLSATDGVASSLGMAFDEQGRLHFLWSDPDSPYSSESTRSAIWEQVYEAGLWSGNAEVTAYNSDQAIADLALTADMSGTLHLAWSEGIFVGGGHTGLDIYYQTGDGAAWGPGEKVNNSAASSRYPSLVVSSDGAALAWQEGPVSDPEVYFARQVSSYPELYRIYVPLLRR